MDDVREGIRGSSLGDVRLNESKEGSAQIGGPSRRQRKVRLKLERLKVFR